VHYAQGEIIRSTW